MYRVDDKMLKSLETLEGYPEFYSRLPIQVQYYEDQTIPSHTGDVPVAKSTGTIQCFVMDKFREELLNLTLLECYDHVDHAAYVSKKDSGLSEEEKLKSRYEVKQK